MAEKSWSLGRALRGVFVKPTIDENTWDDLETALITADFGPDITEAALDGDRIAIDLLSDLGRWIGEGAASIAAVLDPHMFVLGGGVAKAGDLLFEPITRTIKARTLPLFHEKLRIVPAALGNEAGIIGNATLALDALPQK